MSDEHEGGAEDSDALSPPFRPWSASRIPQPGAPPPGIRPSPPSGHALWPTGVPTRSADAIAPGASRRSRRTGPRALEIGLAVLAAATAWFPWFKLPAASLLTLSGSGAERTADAWNVPVRYLWSYRSSQSGPDLGWLILGIAVLILVVSCIADAPARAVTRVLAGLEVIVGVLFLVQTVRLVDSTPFSRFVDLGVTDFAGAGVYLLLAVSVVLVVLPRD